MPLSSSRNGATLGFAAGVAALGAILVVAALPTLETLAGRLYLRILQLQVKKKKKEKAPDATVTALYTYPVKSLRAVALKRVEIGTRGLAHDRQYMLVAPAPRSASWAPDGPSHRFLTQRQCPTLTQVQVKLGTDAGTITLSHKLDPKQSVTLPCEPSSSSTIHSCTLWGDVVRVQDMGDAAAAFLQQVVANDKELGPWEKAQLRLVVQRADDARAAAAHSVPAATRSLFLGRRPAVSLADGFPILIASESSLDDLNARLKAAGKEAMPMARFRPNIVIRGTEPFVEDRFKVLQVGEDVILHVVSSCPRCKQSCTDQETGSVTAEPVATMQSFRQLSGDNVYFAVNAIPAPGSIGKIIRQGDPVKVLQTGVPVWSEG